MKISVAGTGYVGLSIVTLLAQHHEVTAAGIISEKVEKINNRQSTIQDEYIEKYLKEKDLKLTATIDGAAALHLLTLLLLPLRRTTIRSRTSLIARQWSL